MAVCCFPIRRSFSASFPWKFERICQFLVHLCSSHNLMLTANVTKPSGNYMLLFISTTIKSVKSDMIPEWFSIYHGSVSLSIAWAVWDASCIPLGPNTAKYEFACVVLSFFFFSWLPLYFDYRWLAKLLSREIDCSNVFLDPYAQLLLEAMKQSGWYVT